MPTNFLLLSRVIVGINLHIPCFLLCLHALFLNATAYFSVVNTAFGPVSHVHAMLLHTRSAIVSCQEGKLHLFLIVLASLAVLVQYPINVLSSYLLNVIKHLRAFVSHRSMLSRIALLQEPTFVTEAEHTVDFSHHSSAFYSPRYIFASVDLHISPPSIGRTLHPLLQAVLRPPGLIKSTSQNLEHLLDRQPVQPCSRPDRPDRQIVLFVVLSATVTMVLAPDPISPPPRSSPSSHPPGASSSETRSTNCPPTRNCTFDDLLLGMSQCGDCIAILS